MKKILKTLVILSAGMLTTGVVFGKFASKSPAEVLFQKGGFNGKGVNSVIKTVEQVKKMWDDSWATVRGKIVEQISKDKYRFRDSSGEMVVEIDSKYWGAVNVDENDVVELSGKVDRDYLVNVKLDVKRPVKIIR